MFDDLMEKEDHIYNNWRDRGYLKTMETRRWKKIKRETQVLGGIWHQKINEYTYDMNK